MLVDEEGLDRVFRRHQRQAEATRAAVNYWGLELVCSDAE
jgi:alanine-glyoxylate transaminase/serine-glyoxylate transaminase/serine-pyruvate transaminase